MIMFPVVLLGKEWCLQLVGSIENDGWNDGNLDIKMR